ncbi:MAG: ABC transporter ATP-binding protein, partial [Mycobacterium sp.]
QISATPGMPERKAAGRRQARVRENLHLLPKDAQEAILESFENDKNEADKESNRQHGAQDYDAHSRHRDDADTASIPTQRGY